MDIPEKLNLQLFADGAGDGAGDGSNAGGEAATTVVSNSDDGYESKLRALGVPEAKIAKQRAYKSRSVRSTAQTTEQPTVPDATADNSSEKTAQPKARMSWDEIVADPEYKQQLDKHTSDIVRKRVKESGDAQEILKSLAPGINVLARRYGMGEGTLDYGELAKKIEADPENFQELAIQQGVDVETVMEKDRKDRENARKREEQLRETFNSHIQSLRQQGEELKKVFPSFDFEEEMKNKKFRYGTAPGGFSVEEAYYGLHHKEIEAASAQVVAQRTAQNISATIQAGQSRPQEGKATQSTVSNIQRLTREQIRANIEAARRQGKKYYPDGTIR